MVTMKSSASPSPSPERSLFFEAAFPCLPPFSPSPSKHFFFRLLQSCIHKHDLPSARALYSLFVLSFPHSDAFLGCHFIRMFASCGSLLDALHVFRTSSNPDVFTWCAIISAHVKFHSPKRALDLYEEMIQSQVEPDGHVFAAVLKACACVEGLHYGRRIHKRVIHSGLKPDIVLDNVLIDMYMKCGSVNEASDVFYSLKIRDIVTWNAMIAGYAQNEHSQEAFQLFLCMLKERVAPNCITFSSVLKTCTTSCFLCDGQMLHFHLIECSCDGDAFLGSSVTDMYAKCGSLENAEKVFERLSVRSVVSWTAMISGYAQHESGDESLKLFQKMLQEGVEPNAVTIASIVKACAGAADLACLRLLHIGVLRKGFALDVVVGSALVDAYAKHSNIEDAYCVFGRLEEKNVVTWSAMIGGCAQTPAHSLKALQLFEEMHMSGLVPDTATFVSILKACSNLEAIDHGRFFHAAIVETGLECHDFVVSSVIDMYAKCESVDDARKMFDRLIHRDVVVWSSMISGYVFHGLDQNAIELFHDMIYEGVFPDTISFISVLKSCTNSGALIEGKVIHSSILESQHESVVHVGNSLIDMYIACGCIEDGKNVFNRLQERDSVSWTTMISGYALAKEYNLALEYFNGMQKEGLKPDGVSLISLLSACSREARLVEGCQHFEVMKKQDVIPALDHYNCMVDLLGHAGHLEAAIDLLNCMPFMFDVTGWTSLLGQCKLHNNVGIGKHCFDHVVALDGRQAGAYVLMHSLYDFCQ